MNILFDINHPAHVHLFRNAIRILNEKKHKIWITSRDKDLTIALLNNLKLNHRVLSKARKGLLSLGLELICRQIKLIPILIKSKIQICVSVTGACNVHICKLLRIPTLVFYDTEHATLQNALSIPFATEFITPDCFKGKRHINQTTYAGTHDLAYLHPEYFTPDPNVLKLLNIAPNEKYALFRLVAWQAAHDKGQKGLSNSLLKRLIALLEDYHFKIFIVSETKLSDDLKKFSLNAPPEKIHDVLYYATILIGEGGSMATEAAILGTPSIFISSLTAGVFEELGGKYGLMYSFLPDEEDNILNTTRLLLKKPDVKNEWGRKREVFLKDKIDVTKYIIEKIISYCGTSIL